MDDVFHLKAPFQPTGDQPQAIDALVQGINEGDDAQTLLGVTGSGKTFTMANIIARCNRPTLILEPNKTLASQICTEMRSFFPDDAVEYFVSYYDYCMVSYLLKNTVSENGSVARGVCALNEDSTLHSVTERTRIETYEGGIHYTEDGGESWTDLPGETPVSMNLWGFGESFVKEADRRFARWLDENLEKNPLKCEYFLPLVVSELIGEKKAAVKVLRSTDKWYGVTYREDKPVVVEAIAKKTADGLYPENLWA